MANATIVTRQNDPAEIKKLRAYRQLYTRAKRIAALQAVATSIFPVAGAIGELCLPQLRGALAFYGIVIAVLDVVVLEPWQQKTRSLAAKIQDAFDCSVLDLPWDEVKVDGKPEQEDIHSASTAYKGGKDDPELKDWYPAVVAEIPVRLGRIICQRANLRWDADLRRRYRSRLAGALLIIGVIISLVGLRDGFTLEQLTIGVLAPLSPMLLWGIREYRKQGEAADTSDRLRVTCAALWAAALDKNISDDEITSRSRQLQSGIYDRRVNAPVVFNWVYQRMRPAGEENMKIAAAEFVREAKAKGFSS